MRVHAPGADRIGRTLFELEHGDRAGILVDHGRLDRDQTTVRRRLRVKEVAVVRAELVKRRRAVRVTHEQRKTVERTEVIPARVDNRSVRHQGRVEVVAHVEADALQIRAVHLARVQVLGGGVVVLVHAAVTRTREHDLAVGRYNGSKS